MRITKEQYKEMCLKYQTGEFTLTELSKMYKIDKGNLSKYFKKHGIQVNLQAQKAIKDFTSGFNSLNQVLTRENTTITTDTNTDIMANNENLPKNNTTFGISENSLALANEVIDIVKRKNPQFATAFQGLSAMMINKSKEILQGDKVTSSDINNIAGAMSKMNDTLGVFPKMPTIAQQFNFNDKKQDNINENKEPKIIDVNLNFIDNKSQE